MTSTPASPTCNGWSAPYTLALAVFLVTAGRLGDLFGRKRLFVVGLGVFALGSMLCALSGDFTLFSLTHIQTLIAARALQGLGGSIMLPLSLAILSSTFHGRERGIAFGVYGGVTGLATAIGPVLGGLLVEKVNWQSIFWINVPIGIIAIALCLWSVQESYDTTAPRSIDVFGLVTLSAALFCLVLALIQGNDADKGWTSPYILTLFGIGTLALVAFVIGELLMKNPMVDPRLFKNASFTGVAIVAFTLSAGLYSLFFFLTLYLQNYLGFSPLQAGLRALPLSGLVLLTAPLAGAQMHRFGPKVFLVLGMALMAIGVLLMTRITTDLSQTAWLVLLPGFILAGLGSGLVNPPIADVAVSTVSRDRAGMASGVNSVCRQLGTAFGIAFFGAIPHQPLQRPCERRRQGADCARCSRRAGQGDPRWHRHWLAKRRNLCRQHGPAQSAAAVPAVRQLTPLPTDPARRTVGVHRLDGRDLPAWRDPAGDRRAGGAAACQAFRHASGDRGRGARGGARRVLARTSALS